MFSTGFDVLTTNTSPLDPVTSTVTKKTIYHLGKVHLLRQGGGGGLQMKILSGGSENFYTPEGGGGALKKLLRFFYCFHEGCTILNTWGKLGYKHLHLPNYRTAGGWRWLRKFVYFKTKTWHHHHTNRMVFNSTIVCATQLYHLAYRYTKCSLSNIYTLVHPKKFQRLEMLKLFITKWPHWFNKISKPANGSYKNDDSVTRNFTVCFSLGVRSNVQTYYFAA